MEAHEVAYFVWWGIRQYTFVYGLQASIPCWDLLILYNLALSFERLAFILKHWCLPRVKGAVLLASGIIGEKRGGSALRIWHYLKGRKAIGFLNVLAWESPRISKQKQLKTFLWLLTWRVKHFRAKHLTLAQQVYSNCALLMLSQVKSFSQAILVAIESVRCCFVSDYWNGRWASCQKGSV